MSSEILYPFVPFVLSLVVHFYRSFRILRGRIVVKMGKVGGEMGGIGKKFPVHEPDLSIFLSTKRAYRRDKPKTSA